MKTSNADNLEDTLEEEISLLSKEINLIKEDDILINNNTSSEESKEEEILEVNQDNHDFKKENINLEIFLKKKDDHRTKDQKSKPVKSRDTKKKYEIPLYTDLKKQKEEIFKVILLLKNF